MDCKVDFIEKKWLQRKYQLQNYFASLEPIHTIVSSLAYIIHSGFISGYQNRYGDNLKPPTNVYHRMTA